MAKWKNAALITTLVLPLAITAGGEGVAVASQARPNQTTIKIHKQIRYDDTISGLSNDEKYFAWNHGSDEDGQHYFWGDGTEANKDTVTSDGNVVSSNNPFDWTNYRWVGHDEYTVNYTPTDDFAGQNKVTWKDLWSDLPGVHFIGIQLPDNVMTIDDDGEPQIIAKDAKGGVAFTTSDGKDIYWQDILKAQLGVQHSDAANPSHETPKYNFNSKTGTDKYGMKHEVNHSASDFEVEFQQLGAAKDLTEAQIRQALVANYADTDETDPVFGGKAGAVTDENGVLSFNNITNGNWLFMEDLQDSTPGLAEMVTQHAAPIFLATPYLQPNAEVDSKGNGTNKGDKTWFDNTDPNAMHIYAKNYAAHGDLTIEKLDDDTGKALTGVQFAMLELTDDQLADLQEQIDAGLLSKSVTDIKAYLKTLGTEDETLFYGTTGKDGKAKFSNLTPGKTYYALEISTPTGYMVNPTLQKVSLNSVNDTQVDPTVGGDDMTVQAQGGTYTVRNDDSIALDKDINVQNPVTVDNLAVDGYDADGNPNYIDKATNNPYYDDDTLWGVSRGKAFSYTVDAELNKNIGSYSKFNLVDSVPYQVNANSWTMYVQIDGVVTPLLQAVDTQGNANEHSTDDGISNESVAYDSDDHEGVSYKFAEGAEDFAKSLGYTGAFGKDADALAAQTAFVADNLLHMYGQSGNYQFDSEYRSVQSGENGTMNLDFKTDLLKGLGELIKDDTTGHTSVVFKINAQTNSAAQADTDLDGTDKSINNKVTLNYNPYPNPTRMPDPTPLTDEAKTHAAGWDIQKVDENGKPLAGAGFDLGRRVNENNVENVISQLLTTDNNGNVMSRDSLIKAADKLKLAQTGSEDDKVAAATAYFNSQAEELRTAVKNGQTPYVWFVHLEAPTAENQHGELQPIFDVMPSNMQMGDIYWTTEQALATTHMSGDDGYLQYCGLADSRYILTESIVPDGYNKMADQKFTLAGDENSWYLQDTSKLLEFPLMNGDASDNKITGTNEDGSMSGEYLEVENQKQSKSIFPITGGVGILGALAAGLTVMGSAIFKHRRH
ncbi:hypothetical protein K9863_07385 [Lactobacillaceae bacterium KNUT 0156]|nr:hypothetical protein [Weissella cibaria]